MVGLHLANPAKSSHDTLIVELAPEVSRFRIRLGEARGSWDARQERWLSGFGQVAIRGRIAKGALDVDGSRLIGLFDAGRVVSATERAPGVIAVFLEEADLAIEAAEDVHHLR